MVALHLNSEHVAVLRVVHDWIVLVLQIGHVSAELAALEVARQKFALKVYVVSLST